MVSHCNNILDGLKALLKFYQHRTSCFWFISVFYRVRSPSLLCFWHITPPPPCHFLLPILLDPRKVLSFLSWNTATRSNPLLLFFPSIVVKLHMHALFSAKDTNISEALLVNCEVTSVHFQLQLEGL